MSLSHFQRCLICVWSIGCHFMLWTLLSLWQFIVFWWAIKGSFWWMITRGISLCCGMWRPRACEMWGAVWMGDVIDVLLWHWGLKHRLWSLWVIAKQTQIKDSSVLQFSARKVELPFVLFFLFSNIFQDAAWYLWRKKYPLISALCNDLEPNELEKVFLQR